jgi:ligand-binding sensor protein
MAIPRTGPYIWVTWLSKLLVGDASCEWATWFRAHHKEYAKMPRTHGLAAWQMDHAARLGEVSAALESDGKTVLTERQCHFSPRGASGAMLAGRPDLVAMDDRRGGVCDVKTGQPSLADHAQLMTYMYALPHVGRFKGMELSGRIVYRDHEVDVPADAVDDAFRGNLFSLIGRTASPDPPRIAPSQLERAFCDLTPDDCPQRVEGAQANEVVDVPDF